MNVWVYLIYIYFFKISIIGNEKGDKSIYLDPAEIQIQQDTRGTSLISNSSDASRDQGCLALPNLHLASAMKMSPLVFRSAFSFLKQMSLFNSKQLLNENQWIHFNDGENEKNTCLRSNRVQYSNMSAMSTPVTGWNLLSEESSYSCSPEVDPFWPLCMYELRGKCNNDECPWQHVRDYNDGNRNSEYDDTGMEVFVKW